MNKGEYEVLKAKFFRQIASVPIPLKDEIIAVIDDKGVSWNAAYAEIKQDTKNAKIIIQKLKDIGLL